jgi:hypothetical protein
MKRLLYQLIGVAFIYLLSFILSLIFDTNIENQLILVCIIYMVGNFLTINYKM